MTRRLPFLQVDAFTDRAFAGNPAGVVRTDAALSTELMQSIALENNLSETAFLVPLAPEAGRWSLRWFTPTTEVDLCGHATLGAAHALVHWGLDQPTMRFDTASGELRVHRLPERLEMDFPVVPVLGRIEDADVSEALGIEAPLYALREVHYARYLLAQVADEATVRRVEPDIARLGQLGVNVIVTARAADEGELDVVSRFFAPASGVPEDPVTGSAHCSLAPFWAERLGRSVLRCAQLSARGGRLEVELAGDRVKLRGQGVVTVEGVLLAP